MSVKLWEYGKFYGYAVRRSINGKKVQEYFSLKEARQVVPEQKAKEIHQKALQRDAELAELQAKELEKRRRSCRATRRNLTTAVKGVTFVIDKKVKSSGKEYLRPCFRIDIVVDDHKHIKQIAAWDWETAWKNTVKEVAKIKGLKNYSHLVRRCPDQLACYAAYGRKKPLQRAAHAPC